MDLLIAFCRTGQLGPVSANLDLVEVGRLLGPADRSRELHSDVNHQRHTWGSLSLLFQGNVADTGDEHNLRLRVIRVNFHNFPLRLPEPLSSALIEDWSTHDLGAMLNRLEQAGISATLRRDRQVDGLGLMRTFQLGDHGVQLQAVDDLVSYLIGPAAPGA